MLMTKLLAFPLSAAMLAVSGGMDMDYEGEIDIYTGLPVSDSLSENPNQTVSVSDGVTYDRSSHMFSYMIPDQSGSIESSVADGMITTGNVSLGLPSGFSAVLYRDGEEVEDTDYSSIRQSGSYSLVLAGPEAQYKMLSFQIVPEKTGAVNVFHMPAGFQVVKVVLDDAVQTLALRDSIDMRKEGKYQITYRCAATAIDYNLNLTVDHTPPQIVLEGVANGVASNPVKIQGISSGDSVSLYREGQKIPVPEEDTLKSPGKYRLSVTDDAGNTTTVEFEIQFYLNMQGLIFTLLAVGVIIATAVYMYTSKKRLRVR